jgi:diguanylate cyclase (GGDEF)-like protein/PAS domain S-box-containing protein
MNTELSFITLLLVFFGGLSICLWMQGRVTRAQKALDTAQARLQAIFDSTGFGVAITTPKGEYLEANSYWSEKLGYTQEEIQHITHTDITHPDDIAISRQQLAALTNGEINGYCLEKRFLRKDGQIFWAMLSVTAIRQADGRIDSIVGIVHDINDRNLARSRLQRIIQNIPVALLVVGSGDRIEHVNDAFYRLFGYPEGSIDTIHHWREMAYPDPDERNRIVTQASQMVETSRQSGKSCGPMHARVRCYNGDDKDVDLHYIDLDGIGIWTITDITEHRALLEAMRNTNDHLLGQLSEIKNLQEQLREQAIRDVLTGLYNRRYLDEVLERELSRAMREGHPLTVMMLDLDHFKKLNDTYGHQAGDEVLKALGSMLRQNARNEDIPCRYGGEEFLLVLPNMSLSDARIRAEQWREKFAAMQISFGQFSMSGTLSIGIATFPGHGRTRDELIEAADQALYLAKNKGRNRVEISRSTTDE